MSDAQPIVTKTSEVSSRASSSSSGSRGARRYNARVKLPVIDLPKFSGVYSKWLEFYDSFNAIIQNNHDLEDIQKFQYLKGLLTGEAAQVIQALEISDCNYQVAISLLRDRYDNKKRLVHDHIKCIFNLPQLAKENAPQLRDIVDSLTKHLRSLASLKLSQEQLFQSVIIYIIASKFDHRTARDWETFITKNELPSVTDLTRFLNEKCAILESLDSSSKFKPADNLGSAKHKSRAQCLINNVAIKCIFCHDAHTIYNCEKFSKLAIDSRIAEIKNRKRCMNCFRQGHFANKCTGSTCRKCQKRHNTLLHIEPAEVTTGNQEVDKPQTTSLTSHVHNTQVLLATALIKVSDVKGHYVNCRALLDSGSQSNLITEHFVKKLGISTTNTDISLCGIGKSVQSLQACCNIDVMARCNKFKTNLSCLIIDKICDPMPNIAVNMKNLILPNQLPLADPSFHKSGEIDLLLGTPCFWKLLCVGQIRVGNDLTLQKTKLGWVISGQCESINPTKIHCNLVTTNDLNFQLQKFWEIESYESDVKIPNDTEKYFVETTTRDKSGRFIVSLPLTESVSKLGKSREMAEKRFLNLERRLQFNDKLRQKYVAFMREYQTLNHMSEINDSCFKHGFYLPHHGVLNENSLTTKLRVVFDGSASTSSGYSLNDILAVGPQVQNDLFTILVRFRRHTIAVCADVEKMYRQVLIKPDDRYLQKILWREHPSDPLKTYVLNTVTYGTGPAAFMATRSVDELGNIHKKTYPLASNVIKKDIYVDDMLSGADNLEAAIKLCSQVKTILASGCFPLRKWVSNEPDLLKSLNQVDSTDLIYNLSHNENAKTLGLTWCWSSDEFIYDMAVIQLPQIVTKRSMLSVIAQMFDPLGLLGPIIILAKIMLQKLWLEKVSWDETLSVSLHTEWKDFCNSFSNIQHLKVPRHIMLNGTQTLELHGFADASERAYGACVYIKSIVGCKALVQLLCAKSRVAPLKPTTIPRLELCAALLLTKLVVRLIKSLDLDFKNCTLWTDSSIVLSWLQMEPRSLKPFVRNRIYEIQTLTSNYNWRHVSSKDNPADHLSRGVSPQVLRNLEIWWHGPAWLAQPEKYWPHNNNNKQADQIPEMTVQQASFVNVTHECPINIAKFSSLNKLKRCFAYCLRFITNCKARKTNLPRILTVCETENALNILIKHVQTDCFHDEISQIQKIGHVNSNSKIVNLCPFLDKDKLLRIGGRIQASNFNFQKKHPILLPRHHHLTKLIAVYEHFWLGHASPELLLASLRDKYWPISGRNLAKQTFHKCVICFRSNTKSKPPLMGSLPSPRVNPAPVFSNVGIDYAGPIFIRDRKGRGSKLVKSYICLFVCLLTRAIHLELVSELSTEAFMATFKRFISRRGRPTNVYSDNGTNFVGANRELGKFLKEYQDDISSAAVTDNVTWHFIPPRTPHFGGLWEAGVKSTKTHLNRIIKNANLTFEGLYTTLTQIEAILNSRPLSPLSSSPSDFEPLTPAHFLISRKLTALPEPNVELVKQNRLTIFQQAQQLA